MMTEPFTNEWECQHCGTIWNTPTARNTCCNDQYDLPHYTPNYELGYD